MNFCYKAFWYTCSFNTTVDSQSLFKFLRWMSTLFSFQLLWFTTYAPCLLMCYTCCYVHELYISLCLLFRIITIHVGDCSCKTLVINRDVWYAHSSKKTTRMAEQHWSHCDDVLAFIVCFDNKSVFLLSTFSQSGFPIHWFVFAYHFYAVFDCLTPNCMKWCTRCSEKPLL